MKTSAKNRTVASAIRGFCLGGSLLVALTACSGPGGGGSATQEDRGSSSGPPPEGTQALAKFIIEGQANPTQAASVRNGLIPDSCRGGARSYPTEMLLGDVVTRTEQSSESGALYSSTEEVRLSAISGADFAIEHRPLSSLVTHPVYQGPLYTSASSLIEQCQLGTTVSSCTKGTPQITDGALLVQKALPSCQFLPNAAPPNTLYRVGRLVDNGNRSRSGLLVTTVTSGSYRCVQADQPPTDTPADRSVTTLAIEGAMVPAAEAACGAVIATETSIVSSGRTLSASRVEFTGFRYR